MNKIENKQKINLIIMQPDAFNVCELGGDYYKNELTISFMPDSYYPDYTEVQTWIMENIDGKVKNIEDVVNEIYNFLMETYQPRELEVSDHIIGCRTHFNVTVIK